jgi:hypothetical protein
VQGQLRKEKLSCLVTTSCAHCGRPIQIRLDSDLHYTIETTASEDLSPLIFAPMVDFDRLTDPSIIDAF